MASLAALAWLAVPIGGMPAIASVATSVDAGEANVALVKRFLVDVRQAMQRHDAAQVRRVAERYMAADYVQHSAKFEPGREGYIAGMTKAMAAPPRGSPPRDLTFVGDREYVAWMSEVADADGSNHYVFNMFRIAGGRFKEHWDGS